MRKKGEEKKRERKFIFKKKRKSCILKTSKLKKLSGIREDLSK